MSAAALSAIVVGLALLAALVALAVFVRRRARSGGIEAGEPDSVTADVVTGLLAELRGAQAETAYWRSQAERLQREVDDQRSRSGQEPPTQHS